MYTLTLFGLLCVFVVKYYAAAEMRKLKRRLVSVRDHLTRAKKRYQQAREELADVEEEAESFTERVRGMGDLIQDLQLRLTDQAERHTE